jgi:hypothetical protein
VQRLRELLSDDKDNAVTPETDVADDNPPISTYTCPACGTPMIIIETFVSFEDPVVIKKILAHLDDNATSLATALLPDCRASLTVGSFD